MDLPERDVCFACTASTKSALWSGGGRVLFGCSTCGSEWIEGKAPHDQAYTYAQDGETDLANRYYSARARRFVSYLAALAVPKGKLLDVGCGQGEFLVEASALGWRTVGVELSEAAASTCRARSGAPVFAANLASEQLFNRESFDAVTLWGVLEHVPDPELLLRACCALVRPDGLLLLETPSSAGIFRLVARSLMAITGGRFEQALEKTLGAGHVLWYSPQGLRATANRLGLRVVDFRGSRNFTQILTDRFAPLSPVKRIPFQAATTLLNGLAAPLGHPNHILAALRVCDAAPHSTIAQTKQGASEPDVVPLEQRSI